MIRLHMLRTHVQTTMGAILPSGGRDLGELRAIGVIASASFKLSLLLQRLSDLFRLLLLLPLPLFLLFSELQSFLQFRCLFQLTGMVNNTSFDVAYRGADFRTCS